MLRLFLPGDGICDRERRRSDHSQIPPGMVGGMAYEGAAHNLLRGWPSRPVPGCVWQLGDATCGATQATVIFARRVASQAGLDQLASAVRSVHPADKGLVITTSLQVARQVQLPGGYELLPFPEIVRTSAEGLVLDRQRFGSWIRGMRPTTAKGAPTRMGRPSPLALIRRIYHSRREQGLNLDNDSAEAGQSWLNGRISTGRGTSGPVNRPRACRSLKNSEASAR